MRPTRRLLRPLATLALVTLLALSTCPVWADPGLAQQRARALERLFLTERPSVNLSAVYARIPPAERIALLQKLQGMLLAQLPPDLAANPALASLPPQARAGLAQLLPFLRAVKPEQLEALVSTMDLDRFAPIPPAAFRIYHEQALSAPAEANGPSRSALLEADRKSPERWSAQVNATAGFLDNAEPSKLELELLEPTAAVPSAEVPVDRLEPSPIGSLVQSTVIVRLPEHVLVNSARLARALNQLTRPEFKARPMPVRVAGTSCKVKDGVELINSLLATGRYDVNVFDARMFVDFLGYSVMNQGRPFPVKIPTWAITGIDPSAPERPAAAAAGKAPETGLLVPINHSEHLLVFFEKGTTVPAMLVKWYMGIPGAEVQQGTQFRPAVQMRTSWCGYRLVRAYEGADSARQMVRSAGQLMQLYNYLQGRFRIRANGYGVYAVCQDTTGILEVVLGLSGGRTSVWPMLRDPRFDGYYGPLLGSLGLRLTSAGKDLQVFSVPSDTRPDLYPWIGASQSLLFRLGANIPTRDPASLHFPDLRGAVEMLRERSDSFRRGLTLLD